MISYRMFINKTFEDKNALELFITLCEENFGENMDRTNTNLDVKVFKYFLIFELIVILNTIHSNDGIFDNHPIRISEEGKLFYSQILTNNH